MSESAAGPDDATSDDVIEAGPPPAPGTRRDPPPEVTAVAPRRRRWRVVALSLALTLLGAGGGFVGGLAASDRMVVPALLRDGAVVEAEREDALIALLEHVVRTERVMLDFNSDLEDRLAEAPDEVGALSEVVAAAARGVGGLEALRPSLLGPPAGGRVEDVRRAYLPHLDAWIDHLAALVEQPDLLFSDDGQRPSLLLINATAEVFGDELEGLLASGATGRVAELAERILDDGFRSEGPDPSV